MKKIREENEKQDKESLVKLLNRLRDQNNALKNLINRLEERNSPESSTKKNPDKHEKYDAL